MANFADDIFSTPVEYDAVDKLVNSGHIVPEGFTALDFADWWKPMLNEKKYNMAILMMIPVNSYICDKFSYYKKNVVDKFMFVCENRRDKHSDISLTFRYFKNAHSLYEHEKPEGCYLNWFKKYPVNFNDVEFIQFCIAFRQKKYHTEDSSISLWRYIQSFTDLLFVMFG